MRGEEETMLIAQRPSQAEEVVNDDRFAVSPSSRWSPGFGYTLGQLAPPYAAVVHPGAKR
jgi:hypothetical protein